jgi:hypothetical protein
LEGGGGRRVADGVEADGGPIVAGCGRMLRKLIDIW